MDREELEGRVIAARVKRREDLLEEARGRLKRPKFHEAMMFVVAMLWFAIYVWYENAHCGIIGAWFLSVAVLVNIGSRLNAIVKLIEDNE
jgi:hypothetical protein